MSFDYDSSIRPVCTVGIVLTTINMIIACQQGVCSGRIPVLGLGFCCVYYVTVGI
jgi:hypothetical protein